MELHSESYLDDLSLFSSDKLLEPALPLTSKTGDAPDALQLLVQNTLGSADQLSAVVLDGSLATSTQWVESSTDLVPLLGSAAPQDVAMVSLSEAIDLLAPAAPISVAPNDDVDELLQMLGGEPAMTKMAEEELHSVLRSVSPSDIDSILSSSPPDSPTAASTSAEGGGDEDWAPCESRGSPRVAPYSKKRRPLSERKQRKKQQNKEAALRYREKKRQESEKVHHECEQLEHRNQELKDKVDEMSREIKYLKNLLAEVFRARGQSK